MLDKFFKIKWNQEVKMYRNKETEKEFKIALIHEEYFNGCSDFPQFFNNLTFQVMFPYSKEVNEISGEFDSDNETLIKKKIKILIYQKIHFMSLFNSIKVSKSKRNDPKPVSTESPVPASKG